MKNPPRKYLVGVDEVGRGPLAGPVAVGTVLIFAEHYRRVAKLFPIIKDSKKLSAKARKEWFMKIKKAKDEELLKYAIAFIAPRVIDRKGISYAICSAVKKALGAVSHDIKGTTVLLDGGLRAPSYYENQKTIIKGDEKELPIALASIVAKVTRDARMVKLGKKIPAYGFERHKGYGTRAHYVAIKKHGITPHHRKSFLKK